MPEENKQATAAQKATMEALDRAAEKVAADQDAQYLPAELALHYSELSREGEFVSKCQMWLPPLLWGRRVLDVGCRRGKGIYKLSSAVGEQGDAYGLDWNEDFILDARKHEDENYQKTGIQRRNMHFYHGYPEDLLAAGLDEGQMDVVVVNSVLNLAYDPQQAYRQIWRVLKPGGELYLSAVVSDRAIPDDVRRGYVSAGDTIGAAVSIDQLHELLDNAGFKGHRFVSVEALRAPIDAAEKGIDGVSFASMVVRGFKLDDMEADEVNSGKTAIYEGGIPEAMDAFALSRTAALPRDTRVNISDNVARILTDTRYKDYFTVEG